MTRKGIELPMWVLISIVIAIVTLIILAELQQSGLFATQTYLENILFKK